MDKDELDKILYNLELDAGVEVESQPTTIPVESPQYVEPEPEPELEPAVVIGGFTPSEPVYDPDDDRREQLIAYILGAVYFIRNWLTLPYIVVVLGLAIYWGITGQNQYVPWALGCVVMELLSIGVYAWNRDGRRA